MLRFVVSPDSAAIASLLLCQASGSPCKTIVPQEDDGIGPVPIVDSRFEFSTGSAGHECMGVKSTLRFSGVFRSESKAEGSWKDTNVGPPGYDFCGTESFDWSARK